MKIVDLFSGVGGLSLGFEWAGFETVASIDLWGDAIQTYNHNRKNKCGIEMDIASFNHDIKRLTSNTEITGVIGGPPCQGFSSARLSDASSKIEGINESRNQLYLEFYKTVKMLDPDFFLIENVRGMVTLDKGAFVKDIHSRFGKLGYEIVHEIINAADYGVPQNRRRVFFVGLKSKKFNFPKKREAHLTSLEALSDLCETFAKIGYKSDPKNSFQKLMREGSSCVMNHQPTTHSEKTVEIISMIPDGGSIKSLPAKFWEVRKFNKAFQRMNSGQPSLTIDTGHRNYFHFKENRIPTVRESARLQSFPDNFEFLGSKTSQYMQVGNAVPPLLAYEIALQIKKYLK